MDKKLAILTDLDNLSLGPDENLALSELKNRGVKFDIIAWEDDKVPLENYQAAIIRSTWNYFKHYSKFLAWLDQCEQKKVKLYNSASIVKWNMDKSYLQDLAQEGLPIIPTVWIKKGSAETLTSLIQTKGWNRFVLKPNISANSFQTFALSYSEALAFEIQFRQLISERDYLLQLFLESIAEVGEVALIYFNEKFSHGVLKKAKAGDFRVQESFGGSAEFLRPNSQQMDAGDLAMKLIQKKFKQKILYARVDLVFFENSCRVIEVEMIEPTFYFSVDAIEAPKRWVDAILTAHI